jgi:ABC-type uncharacterized transport system substrate-binding protein
MRARSGAASAAGRKRRAGHSSPALSARRAGRHGDAGPRETPRAGFKPSFEIVNSEIHRAEDIAPAIEALKGRADAIYVQTDPIMNTHRVRISTLALGARLPTLSGIREFVEAGIRMSYGPTFPDLFRRAATMSTRF